MKRLLVLAALALMVSGSAFAQVTTPPNQCDITNAPAATLLLPYFNVDFANADRTTAVDTIFTITNVSDIPAIAHVTVWSDWSFPVLDFNLYLTGYDVVGVSLYDILNRGTIPATTVSGSSTSVSPRGIRSRSTNPNIAASASTQCLNLGGNGVIPSTLLAQIRSGLTGGGYFNCAQIGSVHSNAVGYVTADVANTCSQSLPTNQAYFSSEILFDNQLIGDYQRLNPSAATGNFAGGNPLVHIKAVPGGGVAGSQPIVTLPNTFYDRYTPDSNRQIDRRQPLPALFAGRYIGAGSGFATQYLIWREGTTGSDVPPRAGGDSCAAYANNSSMGYTEIVRFDEHENPFTQTTNCPVSPCVTPTFGLPETSAQAITGTTVSPVFPPNTSTTDGGGWTYFNLDNPNVVAAYSNPVRASQNWVVIEMTAEGRYGVDFDAAYLGNGCTPSLGVTSNCRIGVDAGCVAPGIGPQ